MLPKAIDNLSEILRSFPGVGRRGSQKLALDVLDLPQDRFDEMTKALQEAKNNVHFCARCGFFAEGELCEICKDTTRNYWQICLVEKTTDVISVEKSGIYRGYYHVLRRLISPLDNIFAEQTTLSDLISRIDGIIKDSNKKAQLEIILFFKAGFSSEATTAYLKEIIKQKKWQEMVKISRLAQGLPLYYNPETLDQATMVKALEDRREVA